MNAGPTQEPRKKRRRGGVFWRIRRWFIAGLLATAPIGLTVWLVLAIVDWVDATVKPLLPQEWWPSQYLPWNVEVPGVGLLVALVGITIIGALTTGFFGRMIRNFFEGMLNRVPVVRGVYAFLKQVLEMVFQGHSGSFREVVLFEYPRRGTWTIGFITGVTQGEVQNLTDDEMINVFVPTTPNPTSGFFLFVPRKDIVVLSMTVEEGIKMVVSGGMVTPEDRRPAEAQASPAVPALRDDRRPEDKVDAAE